MAAKTSKQIPLNPSRGTSWEVKSRARQCVETGREFQENDVICSRLVATSDGWERQDFSEEAWSADKKEASLFYWRTRFRLPPPKKEEPFKEENAEILLREYLEKNDPEATNTVFILAVMLERKRLLIERGVQRDPEGQQIRIYEHKDSGETFFVVDPELSLDQIGDVQMEVARTLGWIQEEPEPEDGETEAAETESGTEAAETSGEAVEEESEEAVEPEEDDEPDGR
jgi:hypothetical protein